MAAVYSEKEGSLQSNNESSSTEYEKAAVQEVSVDPVRNIKTFDAENTIEEMELALSGPILKAQGHAEVVATNAAVPAVKIKIEELDEDECVSVYQEEAKEGLDGRTTKKEDLSERDQIADGDWLFCCEDSSVAFGNKEGYLEQHRKKIHDGPIVCLDTDSQWDNLLVSTDGGQRTFCCAVCGQRCSSSTEFFQHQLAHRNQEIKQEIDAGHHKVIIRSQVESVFYKTESGLRCGQKMKKVKEEQHNIESFDSSCQVKPSEIPTVQPCVIVQSAEEKSLYRTNRIYVCPICGKVYSYLESFRNHQKLHMNSKAQLSEFSCQKCNKTFSGSASLAIHTKFNKRCVSEEPTNHRCDQCNKSFSSVWKFEAHQEMHKLRPHRCAVCAKCFVSSEGLKRHLLGHDNKKYKCDICQKSFRVPAELRYHYNIHTGAKPYACNFCHKAFAQLGNLITHRKTHLTVFKEGDDVPLGENDTAFIGQNQVLVMKNDILGTTNAVCQEGLDNNLSLFDGESSDKTNFSSELLDEEREPSNEALEVEDWECFECSAHFREEAELHMHYMKHARGEI